MIVVPLAGASRRFVEAGYERPGFMLPLKGRSVFAHAITSLAAYFDSRPFVFVVRQDGRAPDFVEAECRRLGVRDYAVAPLAYETGGPAETVEVGLLSVAAGDTSPLTIFSGDVFRPGFRYPRRAWVDASAGFLEVVEGRGADGPSVEAAPDAEPLVAQVRQGAPAADLRCIGLYHFARAADFSNALAADYAERPGAERTIAPLYNALLAQGKPIHYRLLEREAVTFCDAPQAYEDLLAG